jgi:hypothetical protein
MELRESLAKGVAGRRSAKGLADQVLVSQAAVD